MMTANGKAIAIQTPLCTDMCSYVRFNWETLLCDSKKPAFFCFVLLYSIVGHAQSLTTGLVGYYNFCSCSAKDVSGNNRHGTVAGTPQCVKGVKDHGLLFNQEPAVNGCGQPGGQYIQLPPLGAIWQQGFTACAWVRFDESKTFQRIIDFGNAWGDAGGMNVLFGREANTNNLILESWINTNGAQARTTGRLIGQNAITNGSIEFYCASISNDTMRIYANGVLVAQKKGNHILNTARSSNFIGRSNWCSDDPDFKGFMDEVRIYNRALNLQEIQRLYQTTGVKDFIAATNCRSKQVDFSVQNTFDVDSLKWDFGESQSDWRNVASGVDVSHTYADTGTYTVRLIAYKHCLNDTVIKKVSIYMPEANFLGPDFEICPGKPKVLKMKLPGATFRWQDGSTTDSFTVSQPGTYWLQTSVGNCVYRDTVFVGSARRYSTQNATICEGQNLYGYTLSGIYRDSFALANGCDSIRTLHLAVLTKKNVVTNAGICKGEHYRLPWGRVVNATGIYRDTLKNIRGCDSLIREVHLTVDNPPVIQVTKSNNIDCMMGTATLTATGGATYNWTPANTLVNPSSSKPVASPGATTVYHVKVTTAGGCTGEDSVRVEVNFTNSGQGFLVPSAFTPNGDGKNDRFGVPHWGAVKNLRFAIYNRWSEMIFKTGEVSKCWDGTYKGRWQHPGTYVYVISADTECGTILRKGTVTLIR